MQIIPNSAVINLYYSAGCSCKDYKFHGIFVPAKTTVNFKMSWGFFTGEDVGQRAQMTGEAQKCPWNLFVLGRAGEMPLSAWMVALQQHSSGGWGDQQEVLHFFTL